MIRKPCYIFTFLLCVFATLSVNAMQQSAVTTGQSLSEAQAEAQATYIKALQAFENEQYEQALELMKSVYPELSKNSGAIFALADIYFQLGENDEAIQYARQAVALDDENKWYHLKLADLYQAAGQHSNGIRQLEAAHKRFPRDTDVLNKLAVAYANEGDLMKANEQYNHLLNLDGPSIALGMQKLKIFSLLGLDDSLAIELENVVKLHPQQANTLKLLSSYYRDLGNNTMAQQMLKKAGLDEPRDINTSMPDSKEAWVERLHLLMEQGNNETTLQVALQANEQFPQNAFIYYAIGHSYLAINNYSKALDWLKKGTNLPARSPLKYNILQTLGETYTQLEQWQDAFNSYQKAFDYDEPDAQAMEHMGDILHQLGKPEEARTWWQKAFQKKPNNKELREKISQ